MQKILVLGCQGSGKSTLAAEMGRRLSRPVVHLDTLFWETWGIPNRTPTPDEIRHTIQDVIDGESWIIDGNFSATLDMRLAACDTVILLDLPRLVCLWRVLRRRLALWMNPKRRAQLGHHQRVTWSLLRAIWYYRARLRPRLLRAIQAHVQTHRLVVLSSSNEVHEFLARCGTPD